MKEEQWIEVALRLVAVVDRNVQGWERDFSEEQLEALSEYFEKKFHPIKDFGSLD